MLVFEERGKPEYPEKNLSEQSQRTNKPANSALHSVPPPPQKKKKSHTFFCSFIFFFVVSLLLESHYTKNSENNLSLMAVHFLKFKKQNPICQELWTWFVLCQSTNL